MTVLPPGTVILTVWLIEDRLGQHAADQKLLFGPWVSKVNAQNYLDYLVGLARSRAAEGKELTHDFGTGQGEVTYVEFSYALKEYALLDGEEQGVST